MLAFIIRWSLRNRLIVLLTTVLMMGWGIWSIERMPLDALPDLSDVQVIVKVSYPGKAPQIIENQITYPITTTMLSVPGAKTVRGFSMFGDAYIYILFEEGTDIYWARSRVLEYLSQIQSNLPAEAKASLGPDATGVGWVFEYALVDRSGQHSLADLRALQDWYIKFELQTVDNVSEIASVGGMVKQYQVVLDPAKMQALNISHSQITEAINNANKETGGAVVEMAGAEYMVRSSAYLTDRNDFNHIMVDYRDGVPLFLSQLAQLQIGPQIRQSIAELNGEGEVAGGIVIMRYGKNALNTINGVKEKLAEISRSLPAGVEIVTTYDRSTLITKAIDNLVYKLIEEFIVVALVCAVFLFHFRSALVAIISLPLGILGAFIIMYYQGVNANIMSLGGIAIAIGAMVDAAIVMIENMHKVMEQWRHQHGERQPQAQDYWSIAAQAAIEVGPALFCSLLIVTLSFMPVFSLAGQEGKMFSPLAFTKTYAMAISAGLALTLIPILMGFLIRGKIPDEHKNPLNRWLIAAYEPLLNGVMQRPKTVIFAAIVLLIVSLYPLKQLGSEFMPPLNEGDLLYMPSTLPGISTREAGQLLQITDRLIKSIPEVESVFGKAGRASSATDPAPLSMLETTIHFKPESQWRAGMTMDKLIAELDETVQVPGIANIWVPPIRNRLDMLSTGIKSPIGIKVNGSDRKQIQSISDQIVKAVGPVSGVASVIAERLTDGRYIDIAIDRVAAARYGLSVADLQSLIETLIGGENIAEMVEGRERYPINLRYPRDYRDSLAKLRDLPVITPAGITLTLSQVAQITVNDDPPMIKSENGRLSNWIYVDIRDRDISSIVKEMQQVVRDQVVLPDNISLSWSGQFEYLQSAAKKLELVVPLTLLIVFILLYFTFRRLLDAILIMATLPFALLGGIWLIYWLGYNLSVATVVGFIALAGVSAEFGVIMVLYLNQAIEKRQKITAELDEAALEAAIHEGAVLRVRPKMMTVVTIIAGLLPIMWGSGTGSEVMQRIAAPMIGGMVTAPILSMLLIPAVYLLLHRSAKSKR